MWDLTFWAHIWCVSGFVLKTGCYTNGSTYVSAFWASWTPCYICWVRHVLTLALLFKYLEKSRMVSRFLEFGGIRLVINQSVVPLYISTIYIYTHVHLDLIVWLNSLWIWGWTLQYMQCKYALSCYFHSYELHISLSCRRERHNITIALVRIHKYHIYWETWECYTMEALSFILKTLMQLLKSTHAFNHEFSSGLKFIDLTFKLTHITFNHGAFELSLGSWAIERQNDQVKHHVSSSLFNHYSGVFASFQNKTQRFHCMTLSSFSIYVVFMDPQQRQ